MHPCNSIQHANERLASFTDCELLPVSDETRKADLELIEDLHFEKKEWRAQRIAWFIMALLITLGLIGLFGVGALSSRTISSADGALKLKYDRFDRWQAPSTLQFQLRSPEQTSARLWISGNFLQTVKVESIVPAPERVEVSNGGTLFNFRVARNETVSISFHLQIQQMGSSPIRIRGNDGEILEAPHWVYP